MFVHPLRFFYLSRFFLSAFLSVACLLPLPLMAAKSTAAPAEGYSQRADVRAWASEFAAKEGIDADFLLDALKSVEAKPRILELMDAPIKVPPLWFEYAPRFLNEGRISAGVDFLSDNKISLARAEAYFGVPPEIVTAVIGVETYYGRQVGKNCVLNALTTLAFDYPRRADYFRGELEAFFLLTLDNNFAPTTLKGSYAGAMGISQFMPRSYRHYAVDFDFDGRVDLWQAPDAIGSVAFYLQEHGWQSDASILTPLQLSTETATALTPLLDRGLSEPQPMREWRALGVTLADDNTLIDDNDAVSLLMLDTSAGAEYFLAHDNFRVILRYNKSRLYATAVTFLAEEIKERTNKVQP
ncbi:MAG: lytic murein transglycosylase B [Burkholderiales bacterium]|jgi:membrane-bound lytic murein transglycosylase B|nr:lytic murein transglycosylase B [Burkholderiales bacterium]